MDNKCIAFGVPVTNGSIVGTIKRINEQTNPDAITKGDIILLSNSNPIYSLFIMRSGGVVIEAGARLAHICLIAIELGIPCITQAFDNKLIDGQTVLLCADEGKVYELC